MSLRSLFKFILPVVVIAISLGVFQHLKASKPVKEKPQPREKVWLVDVLKARKQTLSPTIILYGKVESPELLQAAAPGGGIIEQVMVRSGATVKRNQLLVSMDQRDFESMLVQSTSERQDIENQIADLAILHQSNIKSLKTERELARLAEAEVERMLKLKKQNLGTDSVLNNARSALARQQLSVLSRELEVERYPIQLKNLQEKKTQLIAKLNEARLMIERSEVRAPFDAIISDVFVAVGDRVSLGKILVSLYPLDNIEVRAHIPARYTGEVQQALFAKRAQTAQIIGQAGNLSLQLKRLAGQASASGTDAYFQPETAGSGLRPGSLLTLRFGLPEQTDVVAVPFQAIYGNSRIYTLKNERLVGLDVVSVGQYTNTDGNNLLLIKSDQLADGDAIVTTHLPNAVTGLKVKTGSNSSL
jgi:multidrug efflux pump subunit AcrA (membrane-fusion protein)